MAAKALALHIAGMVEDGETIPEPSTLDALAEDPAMKHAVGETPWGRPSLSVVCRSCVWQTTQNDRLPHSRHGHSQNRTLSHSPPPTPNLFPPKES